MPDVIRTRKELVRFLATDVLGYTIESEDHLGNVWVSKDGGPWFCFAPLGPKQSGLPHPASAADAMAVWGKVEEYRYFSSSTLYASSKIYNAIIWLWTPAGTAKSFDASCADRNLAMMIAAARAYGAVVEMEEE